jgi:hypothetical protein
LAKLNFNWPLPVEVLTSFFYAVFDLNYLVMDFGGGAEVNISCYA